MNKFLTHLVILFALSLLTAKSHSNPLSETELASLRARLSGELLPELTLHSKFTDSTHTYRIYLPAGYRTSEKQYSIIYMTDAQWAFEFYAETLDWKKKEVILVGINQGGDFRRFWDFASFGAENYLRFIKDEFIPHIEKSFNSSGERTYMGVSLGGLFGAVLLSDEPLTTPYFKHYLLFDGTFNLLGKHDIAKESQRHKLNKNLNVRILLTSANPGNYKSVSAFKKRYEARSYTGLNITLKEYAIPHTNIAAPSFSDLIDLIY